MAASQSDKAIIRHEGVQVHQTAKRPLPDFQQIIKINITNVCQPGAAAVAPVGLDDHRNITEHAMPTPEAQQPKGSIVMDLAYTVLIVWFIFKLMGFFQ